ncbi:MAG: hypothetical protein AABO58_24435 [Acidobacteriota bacterium]
MRRPRSFAVFAAQDDVARIVLYALVAAAALARLMLQVAALPPYAGLDEVWHVARLVFVLQEGRNPDIREPSVAQYLASATAGDPAYPADFGHVDAGWPEVVRRRAVVVDHATTANYLRSNIEAQQPRLYYSIAGRLGRLIHRTQLAELRFWRMLSILFAAVIVLATARIGETFFGMRGIAAAALLVSLPTWLTLVARASNDAFACMLLALALACTFAGSTWRAALFWALALATKLYTWPALVILLLFWIRQRTPRLRVITVAIACAISIAITIADLALRTHNPLGVLGFDPAATTGVPQPIRYFEMVKVTLASAVWTSGQHWNALTLRGMLLYAVPLLALIVFGVLRSKQRRLALFPLAGLAAFTVAQVVHAGGYIRRARAMGLALPAAGKEGWFWYALAPLIVATLFPMTPIAITAGWLVGWDVIIHEGALFHDFAGLTSPATGWWLFRWGPWHAPFTADLSHVAVGPFASHLLALRLIHLGAVAAVFVLESLLHDRNAHPPG